MRRKGRTYLIVGQHEQKLKVVKAPDKQLRCIKREVVLGDGTGDIDGASW